MRLRPSLTTCPATAALARRKPSWAREGGTSPPPELLAATTLRQTSDNRERRGKDTSVQDCEEHYVNI